MSEQGFTITRTIDADRATVWRAWTDPAIAARWWHPTGFTTDASTVRIDPRVGGEYGYVMTSPDDEQYPTGGRYLEVEGPRRLRCTWGEPGDEKAPELTIELDDAGEGRTAMTFTVDGVEPRPGEDDSVHDGWQQAFDALDDVLQRGVADAGEANDEIRALVQERVDAIARKDASTLARREAAAVRTFNTLPPLELVGSDAVVEQMEAWFDAYADRPRYEVHDLSVDMSGELAYAAFAYRVSGTLQAGDEVDMWVRATLVYRRFDGSWRIVHDHESVPFDAESGMAVLDQGPRSTDATREAR